MNFMTLKVCHKLHNSDCALTASGVGIYYLPYLPVTSFHVFSPFFSPVEMTPVLQSVALLESNVAITPQPCVDDDECR